MKTCPHCGELNGDARNDCFKCGRSLYSLSSSALREDEASSRSSAPSSHISFAAILAAVAVVVVAIAALSGAFSHKTHAQEMAEAGAKIRINVSSVDSAVDAANAMRPAIDAGLQDTAQQKSDLDTSTAQFQSDFLESLDEN